MDTDQVDKLGLTDLVRFCFVPIDQVTIMAIMLFLLVAEAGRQTKDLLLTIYKAAHQTTRLLRLPPPGRSWSRFLLSVWLFSLQGTSLKERFFGFWVRCYEIPSFLLDTLIHNLKWALISLTELCKGSRSAGLGIHDPLKKIHFFSSQRWFLIKWHWFLSTFSSH